MIIEMVLAGIGFLIAGVVGIVGLAWLAAGAETHTGPWGDTDLEYWKNEMEEHQKGNRG